MFFFLLPNVLTEFRYIFGNLLRPRVVTVDWNSKNEIDLDFEIGYKCYDIELLDDIFEYEQHGSNYVHRHL